MNINFPGIIIFIWIVYVLCAILAIAAPLAIFFYFGKKVLDVWTKEKQTDIRIKEALLASTAEAEYKPIAVTDLTSLQPSRQAQKDDASPKSPEDRKTDPDH
jgi:hypothetical protein